MSTIVISKPPSPLVCCVEIDVFVGALIATSNVCHQLVNLSNKALCLSSLMGTSNLASERKIKFCTVKYIVTTFGRTL